LYDTLTLQIYKLYYALCCGKTVIFLRFVLLFTYLYAQNLYLRVLKASVINLKKQTDALTLIFYRIAFFNALDLKM
jgi:hypothetical protein